MRPGEDQIKELMTGVACAGCGTHYERGRVEVLARRDDLWFLRVSCEGCGARGLVAAIVGSDEPNAGLLSLEEPPDTRPELASVTDPEPVDQADVLEMRDFLSGFDGNFKALFNPEYRAADSA